MVSVSSREEYIGYRESETDPLSTRKIDTLWSFLRGRTNRFLVLRGPLRLRCAEFILSAVEGFAMTYLRKVAKPP
jgi:hypothetical protein